MTITRKTFNHKTFNGNMTPQKTEGTCIIYKENDTIKELKKENIELKEEVEVLKSMLGVGNVEKLKEYIKKLEKENIELKEEVEEAQHDEKLYAKQYYQQKELADKYRDKYTKMENNNKRNKKQNDKLRKKNKELEYQVKRGKGAIHYMNCQEEVHKVYTDKFGWIRDPRDEEWEDVETVREWLKYLKKNVNNTNHHEYDTGYKRMIEYCEKYIEEYF